MEIVCAKPINKNRLMWIENFYRRANGKKGIKVNGKEVRLSIEDLQRRSLNK